MEYSGFSKPLLLWFLGADSIAGSVFQVFPVGQLWLIRCLMACGSLGWSAQISFFGISLLLWAIFLGNVPFKMIVAWSLSWDKQKLTHSFFSIEGRAAAYQCNSDSLCHPKPKLQGKHIFSRYVEESMASSDVESGKEINVAYNFPYPVNSLSFIYSGIGTSKMLLKKPFVVS